MDSKNYKQIKSNFEEFISTWTNRDSGNIKAYVHPWISAYVSTSIKMPNGSQASIFGIRDFIDDFPESDRLSAVITNYTCRIQGRKAVSYALVVCRAENNDGRTFDFVAMIYTEWVQEREHWLMRVLRMDVKPEEGALKEEFEKQWFFEKQSAVLTSGVHLPCIRSEFDTPWDQIRESEVQMDEKDQVIDGLNQFLFGLDFLRFDYCYALTSEDFDGYGLTGDENYADREDALALLKYRRQRSRHHVSPCVYEEVFIDHDSARVQGRYLFRTSFVVELKKQDGIWKIRGWKENIEEKKNAQSGL